MDKAQLYCCSLYIESVAISKPGTYYILWKKGNKFTQSSHFKIQPSSHHQIINERLELHLKIYSQSYKNIKKPKCTHLSLINQSHGVIGEFQLSVNEWLAHPQRIELKIEDPELKNSQTAIITVKVSSHMIMNLDNFERYAGDVEQSQISEETVEDNRYQIKQQLESLHQQFTKLKRNYQDSQYLRQKLTKDRNQYSAKAESLHRQITIIKNSIHEELQRIHQFYFVKQQRHRNIYNEEIQGILSSFNSNYESYRDNMKELICQNQIQQSKCKQQSKRIQQLEQNLKESTIFKFEITSQMIALRAAKQKLQEDLKESTNIKKQQQKTIKSQSEELQHTKLVIEEKNTQIEKLDKNLLEKNLELTNVINEKDNLQLSNLQVLRKIQDLQKHIAQANQENEGLSSLLEEVKENQSQLSLKLFELQSSYMEEQVKAKEIILEESNKLQIQCVKTQNLELQVQELILQVQKKDAEIIKDIQQLTKAQQQLKVAQLNQMQFQFQLSELQSKLEYEHKRNQTLDNENLNLQEQFVEVCKQNLRELEQITNEYQQLDKMRKKYYQLEFTEEMRHPSIANKKLIEKEDKLQKLKESFGMKLLNLGQQIQRNGFKFYHEEGGINEQTGYRKKGKKKSKVLSLMSMDYPVEDVQVCKENEQDISGNQIKMEEKTIKQLQDKCEVLSQKCEAYARQAAQTHQIIINYVNAIEDLERINNELNQQIQESKKIDKTMKLQLKRLRKQYRKESERKNQSIERQLEQSRRKVVELQDDPNMTASFSKHSPLENSPNIPRLSFYEPTSEELFKDIDMNIDMKIERAFEIIISRNVEQQHVSNQTRQNGFQITNNEGNLYQVAEESICQHKEQKLNEIQSSELKLSVHSQSKTIKKSYNLRQCPQTYNHDIQPTPNPKIMILEQKLKDLCLQHEKIKQQAIQREARHKIEILNQTENTQQLKKQLQQERQDKDEVNRQVQSLLDKKQYLEQLNQKYVSNMDKIQREHEDQLKKLQNFYQSQYENKTINELTIITTLKNQVNKLQEDNLILNSQLHQIQSTNLNLQNDNITLRTKLTQLDSGYQQQKTDLLTKYTKITEDNTKLNDTLSEKKNQLKQIKDKLGYTSNQLEKAQNKRKLIEEQLSQKIKEIKQIRESYKQYMADHESALRKLEERIIQLSQNNLKVSQQLTNQKNTAKLLYEKCKNNEQTIRQLEAELSKLTNNYEKKVNKYQQQIQKNEQLFSEFTNQMKQVMDDNQEFERVLADKNEKLCQYEGIIEYMEAYIEQLTKTFNRSTKQNDDRFSQYIQKANQQQQEISQLQKQLEQSKQLVQQSNQVLEKMKKKKQTLMERNDDLQALNQKYGYQVKILKQRIDGYENDREELQEMTRKVKQLKDDNGDIAGTLISVKRDFQKYKSIYIYSQLMLDEKLKSFSERLIQEKQIQIKQLHESITEHSSQKQDQLSTEVLKLYNQNIVLSNKISSLQSQLNHLHETFSDYKQKYNLEITGTINKQLVNQLELSRCQLAKTQIQLQNLIERINLIESEKLALQDKISSIIKQIEKKDQLVSKMAAEIKEISNEKNSYQFTMDEKLKANEKKLENFRNIKDQLQRKLLSKQLENERISIRENGLRQEYQIKTGQLEHNLHQLSKEYHQKQKSEQKFYQQTIDSQNQEILRLITENKSLLVEKQNITDELEEHKGINDQLRVQIREIQLQLTSEEELYENYIQSLKVELAQTQKNNEQIFKEMEEQIIRNSTKIFQYELRGQHQDDESYDTQQIQRNLRKFYEDKLLRKEDKIKYLQEQLVIIEGTLKKHLKQTQKTPINDTYLQKITQYQQAESPSLKEFQSSANQLKNALNQLKINHELLQNQFESVKIQKQSLTIELGTVQLMYDNLQKAFQQRKQQSLNSTALDSPQSQNTSSPRSTVSQINETLALQNQRLTKQVYRQSIDSKNLRNQINNLSQKLSTNQQQLTKQLQNSKNFQTQSTNLQTKIKSLQQHLKHHKQQSNNLKQLYKKTQSIIDENINQSIELQAHNQRLKLQISQKDTLINQYKAIESQFEHKYNKKLPELLQSIVDQGKVQDLYRQIQALQIDNQKQKQYSFGLKAELMRNSLNNQELAIMQDKYKEIQNYCQDVESQKTMINKEINHIKQQLTTAHRFQDIEQMRKLIESIIQE